MVVQSHVCFWPVSAGSVSDPERTLEAEDLSTVLEGNALRRRTPRAAISR
jgi:hypothetical protein